MCSELGTCIADRIAAYPLVVSRGSRWMEGTLGERTYEEEWGLGFGL